MDKKGKKHMYGSTALELLSIMKREITHETTAKINYFTLDLTSLA